VQSDQSAELMDLLRRTVKGFQYRIVTELRAYGLSLSQMWVLRGLIFDGRQSLAELSKNIGMSTSNVSGIVERLVQMELVQRDRDVEDRRVVWIKLSDKGQQASKEIPALADLFFQSLMTEIPDEDAKVLIKQLRSLVKIIEHGVAHQENWVYPTENGKEDIT